MEEEKPLYPPLGCSHCTFLGNYNDKSLYFHFAEPVTFVWCNEYGESFLMCHGSTITTIIDEIFTEAICLAVRKGLFSKSRADSWLTQIASKE